jgi:hypothetical protein
MAPGSAFIRRCHAFIVSCNLSTEDCGLVTDWPFVCIEDRREKI